MIPGKLHQASLRPPSKAMLADKEALVKVDLYRPFAICWFVYSKLTPLPVCLLKVSIVWLKIFRHGEWGCAWLDSPMEVFIILMSDSSIVELNKLRRVYFNDLLSIRLVHLNVYLLAFRFYSVPWNEDMCFVLWFYNNNNFYSKLESTFILCGRKMYFKKMH